ncbi:MAG: UDP-N-acetylmuramoyl-L-alanyl-D-glutamate--2,6-diaminopimelate ligase, partial [Firmicutes bacterium]|nr:UDP-N-acetylmuramoyl-L-alanyl-D-glutamate--2,6-diaminopimelate ligase [Bacillota bacterium]
IENGLKTIRIPGRTEFVDVSDAYTVMVDYAHNGFALENLLKSLSQYQYKRLIVVFGCGGNRDVNRRYEMGKATYDFADVIIVTSDNPRDEDPLKIIKDITSVMDFCDKIILAIPDRGEAIKKAVNTADEGDIVVIAGKGHETYQIIGKNTIHFDDREAILSCRKEQ